ncbi:hypothetical protein N7471_003612 [Penicillium samsonianum]|uniref:uncharacterized protein n=1 Tax=Penicillium samsonianum TaxID=1882272 RepID=UPI002546C2D2|nr:uncharacterized protein N7471_003612 [Penicillium samsonianum]KAJ6137126.1 hypothetical protein N7471_003612 [Penicillium samsonianum]
MPRPPITTEERVAVLTRVLDPNDSLYLPNQTTNIVTLIDLYNKGMITVDDEVFVVDGRVASREECIAAKKPYFWERGNRTGHQLAQKASYGHGPYTFGYEVIPFSPQSSYASSAMGRW